jgi:hypothetical protein
MGGKNAVKTMARAFDAGVNRKENPGPGREQHLRRELRSG